MTHLLVVESLPQLSQLRFRRQLVKVQRWSSEELHLSANVSEILAISLGLVISIFCYHELSVEILYSENRHILSLTKNIHFVTISLFPNPGEMTREVARFRLSIRGLNNHVVDEVWCGWINIPGKEEVNVLACQLRIFMLFLTLTFPKLVWYVELMTTQVVGQLMSEGSQWVDTQLPMFQASTQFPSL